MVNILRAIEKINPLEDLVDDYSDRVYKFCRRLTYSKEDAEDLFQETFLWAFERLAKVPDNPRNFLFSAAAYLWKSRKRKYARRNRLAPTSPLDDTILSDTDIEGSIMAQEDTRIVRELVHALPEKLKIPIVMFYTAEMELSEIAEALRIPVGTVKSRMHKARKIIEKGLVAHEKGH
jgi:RNA polymerase sigma-70 factor (ECF subfamily)